MRFVSFVVGASALLLFGMGTAPSAPPPQATDAAKATPLILEKNEGELRIRRFVGNKMGITPFILKIDPKNGGSQNLVMLTEDLAPGVSIPAHRHAAAEEILILQTGAARVHLGSMVKEVQAGATVFIPPNTWISVDSIGSEPISLVAIFSEPGFEEYLRAISVRPGEKNVPVPAAELAEIRKKHSHAVSYQ